MNRAEQPLIVAVHKRPHIGEVAWDVRVGTATIQVILSHTGLITTRAFSKAKPSDHERATRAVKAWREDNEPSL